MKSAVIATAFLLLAGCGSSEPAEPALAADIATILDDPSAYDRALVRTRGAAVVRFEASFICPSSEALEAPDGLKKCLSLVPGESEGMAYDIGQLDGKVVEIIGRFDAGSFGHMGAYGGQVAVAWSKVTGSHNMIEAPPPPPPPVSSR